VNRIDPAGLADALPAANLAVLVAAVAHVTGDLSVLGRHDDPRAFDHGRGPGSLTADEADAIRAWAHDALTSAPDDAFDRAPDRGPDAATLHRLVEFVVGEPVDPAYVPLVEEEADFDGTDRRRFVWTQRPDAETLAGFHVGIIGAGLGGLCAAIRLEQAGIPYTVLDKNDDVGGTWFENTYPDLRVDVPNHFYSYSFRPNPDWSHFYSRQHELCDYIAECAKAYHVLPHVRFGTEVQSATFDEARGTWRVHVRDARGESELEVNVLVSAVGMLNRPAIPDLEGLDTFAGPWFHSSHWDHDLDLEGKRVVVIGTGASAMQFVPAVAPEAEHVTIFQRSRHWVTPNPDYHRSVTDAERWLFRNVPHYLAWYRVLQFWNSADRMYPAFHVDPAWADQDVSISRQNDKLRRVMTAHVERELAARPELVDAVLPDYPALGKRMLQDNGWFRTLLRDDVELVNERVARVEPPAVVTESGARHEADVLVLGTGFHPNKYLWPMVITGRGRVLHEEWGEDPRAHVGITGPGFPNLFCLYGPNTNPVVGSVVFVLECQVNYVVKAIGAMLEHGWSTMECRREVHDAYNERVDAEHEQLVWRHPRVHSYYNNDAGRVTTNMPWKLVDYWRMTHEPALDDFVVTSAERGG
jgi:4-hydroxyacetophenone monooxygenase